MQVSHSVHRCFVMVVVLLYHHNLVLGFCLSCSVDSCVLERSCGSVEQLSLILVQTRLFIWFGLLFFYLFFCMPKFSTYKNKENNTIINICRHFFAVCLFSRPQCIQFWVFGGICVSLMTSCCHSVCFCLVLCVVSAMISWAVQGEACIFIAKYKRSPFFWKQRCKFFSDFHWEQNETEKKWKYFSIKKRHTLQFKKIKERKSTLICIWVNRNRCVGLDGHPDMTIMVDWA